MLQILADNFKVSKDTLPVFVEYLNSLVIHQEEIAVANSMHEEADSDVADDSAESKDEKHFKLANSSLSLLKGKYCCILYVRDELTFPYSP